MVAAVVLAVVVAAIVVVVIAAVMYRRPKASADVVEPVAVLFQDLKPKPPPQAPPTKPQAPPPIKPQAPPPTKPPPPLTKPQAPPPKKPPPPPKKPQAPPPKKPQAPPPKKPQAPPVIGTGKPSPVTAAEAAAIATAYEFLNGGTGACRAKYRTPRGPDGTIYFVLEEDRSPAKRSFEKRFEMWQRVRADLIRTYNVAAREMKDPKILAIFRRAVYPPDNVFRVLDKLPTDGQTGANVCTPVGFALYGGGPGPAWMAVEIIARSRGDDTIDYLMTVGAAIHELVHYMYPCCKNAHDNPFWEIQEYLRCFARRAGVFDATGDSCKNTPLTGTRKASRLSCCPVQALVEKIRFGQVM